MASKPSVALRLGMEGADQITAGLQKIADTGSAASKKIADDFERTGDTIDSLREKLDKTFDPAQAKQLSTQIEQLTAKATAAGQKLAAIGGGFVVGNTDQNAQVQAFLKYQQDQTKQAEALRAAIDPLRVAQAAYDAEIKTANSLLAQNKITEGERDAAVALSAKTLADATKQLDNHSSSLGLNRTQMMIAEGATHRFVDSILAGQSPMRAFMMQAGDVGNILAMDNGGVAGGLSKVMALLTPTNILIAAGAALVAGATATWVSYSEALDKLSALSLGAGAAIGANGQLLEQQAEAAAKAGNISVSSARDIEAGYVSLGGIGNSVLSGLTAITTDFAAATGKDAKGAVDDLGKAFQNPIEGAADLAAKYGFLTQEQIDHIQKLQQQGDLYGAQAELLADLQTKLAGAADHTNILAAAWHNVSTEASSAWSWLGKAIDRAIGGGGTDAEKLATLVAERARALKDSYGLADTSDYDKQIAVYQGKLAAPANAARQRAQQITDDATGASSLDSLRQQAGGLRTGIAAGGSPDQLKAWADQLDAVNHALSTFIPQEQKANELAEAQVKIDAARTPAQKAAAAAEKERITLAGARITQADADARVRDAAAAATGRATKAGETHAATLAREAKAQDVATAASLALADAYLQGGAAALIAEARRKAMTDATKKGADVEAEVRRQIALTVAEGIANGAKAVSQLDQENEARTKVIAAVGSGALAVGQMNDALSDENALRPLLILRSVAEGAARDKLTAIIARQTAALAEQHALQQQMAAMSATQAANDNITAARDATQFAGDRSGAGDIEIARRAAQRDANRQYSAAPQSTRDAYVAAQVGAAQAKQDETRAKYLADMKNSQEDSLRLSQGELETVTMGTDQRQIALDKLKATIDLEAHGVDLESDKAKAILAGVEAQDLMTQAVQRAAAAMQEVRDFAGTLVDDLASGKNIAQDLYQEFLKLAAINPLKNLINGNNNLPTLGSIFSLFTPSLNTGISSASLASTISATAPTLPSISIPGFASGTDYAPGGLAWVGENGKELMNLPRGTQIFNASQSRQMVQQSSQPAAVRVEVVANDYFDARVADVSDGRVAAAAPAIAAGGGRMGQRLIAQRQRYSLNGR